MPPAKAPLALPDKPSLAVLPFQNLSGDPEQDYFVDGVVEEITTAISRLHWMFVIARNSSFAYKGRSPDLRQVGRELGVRYVLEGSVRKAGSRVRITGQLIDTTTGAHIWADRFDGARDDILELQDQVAGSVVGAIEPKLRQSEIERAARKQTDSLDAYDVYLRALEQFYKFNAKGSREAIRLLRGALEKDPSYAPAIATIGLCRIYQRALDWDALSDAEIEEAVQLARRVIEIGSEDPDALWMAGWTVAYFAGDRAAAASLIDRALALNPNSALAWGATGWVRCYSGQPDPAIEAIQRAMRLSPRDPLAYLFKSGLAFVHLAAGRYQEAIKWVDEALFERPRLGFAMRVKVVACAHLGRFDEGREYLGRLLELQPGLTVANFIAYAARIVSPEMTALCVDGFRKIGLPED